ncbi:MAG: RNA 2',3'-cyclic phosphodiesterase [Oceanibaculum sp.]
MIRLFVALSLPAGLRQRLALMGGGIPGAKWVETENLHLTLRFIGEVEEGLMQDIDDALLGVDSPPFELVLAGVGHWETRGKATALWAGVEKSPELLHLHERVEAALMRAGLPPEPRKFAPHVTLARLKNPPSARVGDFLREHGIFRAPPFAVQGFALYSSILGATGPTYREEAFYPLSPNGPVTE